MPVLFRRRVGFNGIMSISGRENVFDAAVITAIPARVRGEIFRKVATGREEAFPSWYNPWRFCRMEENGMTIRLYGTSTCPWCEKVKEYLRRRGVAFEECDIARDPGAAETVKMLTGQVGVPVLDINGRVIVGFDRDSIDDALGALVGAN